ncbi:MAG: DsbE family thiol:disulfide interchange protein [Salinarimonadaceae bacterium]|nr:MAG: DsbE family thiol:disulfide interchange protein [Salinarimonadaceae bacterium]
MREAAADAPAKPGLRFVFILPVVLFLGLAGVFFARLYGDDPSMVPSVLINRPAPEFALAPLEGLRGPDGPVPGFGREELVLADDDPTRVSVVNVWASWCVPCRDEHPVLMRLAQDGEVQVMGINYKDATENARRFLGALGNPFAAVGVDPNGRSAIDWGVYGVPETFIVDAQGVIRHKHIGQITPAQIADFFEKVEAAKSPL